MPLGDNEYRLRERAESFGAVASAYDRYRPAYPDELIDDLVAPRPGHVLDIGAGTGIASRLLSARGLDVLGVEPDPAMAEVARGHGLDVELGNFETWDDNGRRFDLITCAQAWHWVDPHDGAPKAARLLNPGGTVALFWNFDELEPDVHRAVNAVYERLEPALVQSVVTGANRHSERPYLDQLRAGGAFTELRTRDYRWERTYSIDDWIAVLGTHSDHLRLPAQRLADLQYALRDAVTAVAEQVRLTGGTYAIFAQP